MEKLSTALISPDGMEKRYLNACESNDTGLGGLDIIARHNLIVFAFDNSAWARYRAVFVTLPTESFSFH